MSQAGEKTKELRLSGMSAWALRGLRRHRDVWAHVMRAKDFGSLEGVASLRDIMRFAGWEITEGSSHDLSYGQV